MPAIGGQSLLRRRPGDGVLSAVGSTPLVALTRLYPELPVRVFGKLEMLNPSGSLKDRPARRIIEHGLESGEIGPHTVVVSRPAVCRRSKPCRPRLAVWKS